MDDISIYFAEDTDLISFECSQKGFRWNVVVRIDNENFCVNIYDITRLKQDFDTQIGEQGYYSVDFNLLLVPEVNKKNIIRTIKGLYNEKYFEEIKPNKNIDISTYIKIY